MITRKTFDEVMFPCYKPQNMMLSYGKGSYLYDSNDKKYVDFTSGIAVNCLGHNNKKIVNIIKKQSKKFCHISNIFVNKKTLKLAKLLTEHTDFEKVFFVNSGAEANEAALKLARRYAFDNFNKDKDEIISFYKSFHGRTFFTVCTGGQSKYSDGFGPKVSSIKHLPYNDLSNLDSLITDKTCAVILEPIQGEGGIIEAQKEFLLKLRELCDKHKALLIFDEVQTGVGRLGSLYAYMDLGVVPDILTSAKGIGGGLPLGAVLTFDKIAKHFSLGVHGSTFGGNPVSCAVGCHVIKKISDKDFLDKVKEKGEYIKDHLKDLQKSTNIIKDIRGKGLLIGIELQDAVIDKIGFIQSECAKNGLLVLTAGHGVIRLAPALNIKKKVIKEGLSILDKVLLDISNTLK